MGLRTSISVCATSFLMGLLFTHWIADSLTLWRLPSSDANFWRAAQYYNIIYNAPLFMGHVVLAIVALGGLTFAWSFGDGAAFNLMFDGGSIFLYGMTIAVYVYNVLPTVMDNFTALPASHSSPAALPEADATLPFPSPLRDPAVALASSNLICSVALTGVLALQAARWWTERSEREEAEADEKKRKADASADTTTTASPTRTRTSSKLTKSKSASKSAPKRTAS